MADAFIASLARVPWLASAGQDCEVRRVPTIQSVFDVERGFELWSRQTHAVEAAARQAIGEATIDEIFSAVGDAVNDPVAMAVGEYLDRRCDDADDQKDLDSGLYPEVVDAIGRDVAWAAIERRLDKTGFFSELFPWYLRGRWPCSWDGDYPAGTVVVL